MPVSIYRRHKESCPLFERGREATRCTCMIWIDGIVGGKPLNVSLKTRDWVLAEEKARRMERDGDAGTLTAVAFADAVEAYKADLRGRNVREGTIVGYSKTLEHLGVYLAARKIEWLDEITPDLLAGFRNGRVGKTGEPLSPTTSRKELENLRSFFNLAVDREWIQRNPAKKVKAPKNTVVPTQPYEPQEVTKLLAASGSLDNANPTYLDYARKRANAFQLVMLHTGLRISDVARLRRDAIDPKTRYLFLRAKKNGQPVRVKLPEETIRALDQLHRISDTWYFHRDDSDFKTTERSIQRTLEALGRLSSVHCHAHRYRDTFAVELLNNGTDIRHVQLLLGHESVKTTEKHYGHFVRAQQKLLDAATDTLRFGVKAPAPVLVKAK